MRYLKNNEPLLVIIGPSGSGKSLLVEKLVSAGTIELTPSWTTRPKRKDEEGAFDHIFVDEQDFKLRQDSGYFLETVQLFNTPYLYGLPKVAHNSSKKISTIMLRSMIIPLLRKHYSNATIYQIESDEEVSRKRLDNRENNRLIIESRLRHFNSEVEEGRKIANRVFYNNAELSVVLEEFREALLIDFF